MDLGPYRIEVATEYGPRITSLRVGDGEELLARLGPESALTHHGGQYLFRGGHRLWAAPEVPDITYASDDHECVVTEGTTIRVTAPADSAGVVKEVEVAFDDGALVVDHHMRTESGSSVTLAPWAITQFPLGGTAILPLTGEDTTPQANRSLVMWPYTSIEDSRVSLRDEALTVDAAEGGPIKFGAGPAPGRLGYFRNGSLFIKEIEPAHDRTVPDFGAVGQVYVGMGFCELESLGGLAELADGQAAVLREMWTVSECDDLETAIGLTVG